MAIDMQESKGSTYSDRELTTMLRLVGWGETLSFSNPGPFFRKQRAYMHKLFGTQAAMRQQYSTIEEEGYKFLRHLLSSPEDLSNHVRQYVSSSNA
jgi:hypothetical protein